MEPLSVAMHAISTVAKLRANQTVAIFGCGPVGLLCMAVAKALGASRIIAVDIVPSRVEFAVNTQPLSRSSHRRLSQEKQRLHTHAELQV